MSDKKKYDYDATLNAFESGHIFKENPYELKKYLSGVSTTKEIAQQDQQRADRMSGIICSLLSSYNSEQSHRDTVRIAKIATVVAVISALIAFASLFQGKPECGQSKIDKAEALSIYQESTNQEND